jgi:signal transduction histidine kinase
MRWKRAGVIAAISSALLLLVMARSGFRLPPGAHRLARAACAPADGPAPPADAAAWTRTDLPWDWRPHGDGRDRWCRVSFTLAEVPVQPLQLLIAQVAFGAQIFVNGERVADVGRERGALWGRREPVWTPIPADALRAGANELLLQLNVTPAFAGYLTPIYVGPAAALHGQYRARSAFISAPDVFALVSLALAFVYWAIYRRARSPEWGWLAAGIGALSLAGLPWRSVDFLVWPLGLGGAVLCVICAAHRIGKLERRGFERAGALLLAAGALTALLAQPRAWFGIALATAALDFALALYLYRLHRSASLSDWLGSEGILSGALAVSVLLSLNDFPMFFGRSPALGLPLFPIAHAPVVVASFGHVVAFLSDGLARERALNQSLRERQERLVALERERAARVERERVQRELHDGVGAQLIAALAAAEREPRDDAALTRALQLAIGELRGAVDSLDEAELQGALGALRSRLEPLVRASGARFAWRVGDVEPQPTLAPEQLLHLLRILQEAITNAVKHAGAQTIEVASGAEQRAGRAGAFVEVRDDGRGALAPRPGRGIANMRQRAELIGGELTIESGERGTSVRLWLASPLTP